jgi:two-component system response regulator NreC
MSERPITIILADDHLVVREGIRILLECEPGFKVIGEASDGLAVPDLVARLRPEVLVLDLMLPGMRGLEVLREVRKSTPATRVVVLSMYGNDAYVAEALRGGASGYVVKDSGSIELIRAIREAVAGRRYLSPPLSERLAEISSDRQPGGEPNPYHGLTPREREVLQLTIEGFTSAQTAARLGISPRTVEVHRANILHKLGLRGQADLVRYAYRSGILKAGGIEFSEMSSADSPHGSPPSGRRSGGKSGLPTE